MLWLSTIGVAIYENGVAIYEWCGYLRMVWLSTKKVWLFQLAFLGLLVGAKNILGILENKHYCIGGPPVVDDNLSSDKLGSGLVDDETTAVMWQLLISF